MIYQKIGILIIIILSIHLASAANPNEFESAKYTQFVVTDFSPLEFYPSDVKTINITVQNILPYSVYDVVTAIDPIEAEPLKFINQVQKYISSEIRPNQSFTVQFEISIKNEIPEGVYYIPLSMQWSSEAGGTMKSQKKLYIGIPVGQNPELIKIDMINITTIPEHIIPNNVFLLKIRLRNIGNDKLNQIRASLDVRMPFSSIGSGNEQYISSLEPDQSVEVVYNLQVDKQAVSQLYNFNFTFEYKDSSNRFHSQHSNFGVNVEELPTAYIQDVTLDPTTLNPSSTGLLLVQIANAGTNEIRNVRVAVFGGEKILTQTQNFIGIISPQKAETTSFGVHVDPEMELGKYGLNFQINYDDINGKHKSTSNMYIVRIDEEDSIIPISEKTLYNILYSIIFVIMSYCIFLVVGFQIDKKK